jgi:hypothetical protein
MTPPGIEPATFRFVVQHLNHCATAVPNTHVLNTHQEMYSLPCSPTFRYGATTDNDGNEDGYATSPLCVCVCVRACAHANFGNAGAHNQTLLFEMEKALSSADTGKVFVNFPLSKIDITRIIIFASMAQQPQWARVYSLSWIRDHTQTHNSRHYSSE